MIMRYSSRYKWASRLAKFEAPQMNVRRVAKNTVVLYFRMFAVMLVSLFTSRMQLQILGTEDYGLYQVAVATVAMFSIMNGALNLASSRFLTVEMGKGSVGGLKRTFSVALTVHFALAVAVSVLLETVGVYLLNSKLNIDPTRLSAVKYAFHCGVVTMFFSITQAPYSAVIVAHERMSAFAWMSVYDVGAKLAVVFLLLFSPIDKLVSYATLLTCVSLTSIMIYRIYCIRNFTEARYRRVFDWSLARQMFSFTGYQIASYVVVTLAAQGLIMVNQRCFGAKLIAAMTLATTVSHNVMSFIGNFRAAANPQVVKLFAAGQRERALELLNQMILMSLFLMLIVGMPVAFYTSEALAIWLGNNVPEHTATFVRIALCGALATIFDGSFFMIIYADGRMKANTICDVCSFGLAFITALAVIFIFRSPYAASVSLVAAYFVQGFVQKPILLRFVAGYSLRNYFPMLMISVVAIFCTGATTYMIHSFLEGTYVAIPACALAAMVNAWFLLTFFAPEALQKQIPRILCRYGRAGSFMAQWSESYFGLIWHVRRITNGVFKR